MVNGRDLQCWHSISQTSLYVLATTLFEYILTGNWNGNKNKNSYRWVNYYSGKYYDLKIFYSAENSNCQQYGSL